jgi:threonine dehydrogenase-like Zn-dependent dehydrogenase
MEVRMRGATLLAPREVEVTARKMPDVAPDGILVEVSQVALCASEVDRYTGRAALSKPMRFGHEVYGRVVEVGRDVTGVRVGTWGVPYDEPIHGCAEYVAVAANRFIPVRQDMPGAVLTELAACAIGAVQEVGVRATDTVVICGGTGTLGTLIRRYLAARYPDLPDVYVLGRDADALARARHEARTVAIDVSEGIGEARQRILAETDGAGAAVVLEASGAEPMMEAAPSLARVNGTVGVAGYPPSGVTMDWHTICGRAVQVRTLHWRDLDRKMRYMRIAADMIGDGTLDVADLVGAMFHLSQVGDAFEAAASGATRKAVVSL